MTQDYSTMELKYHQIADLYTLAEELLSTAENPHIENPSDQLDLVEPLVNQIGDSTDILCEEFIEIAGKKDKSTTRSTKVERALRKLYTAIDTYQQHVASMTTQAIDGLRNLADPIVEKIKLHIETVIAIFLDFVHLTLDRIMHKQQVEELKKRHEKIAQLLYVAERNRTREMGA